MGTTNQPERGVSETPVQERLSPPVANYVVSTFHRREWDQTGCTFAANKVSVSMHL